jgi:hypothetical protein
MAPLRCPTEPPAPPRCFGGSGDRPRNPMSFVEKARLDVAALTISKGASHVAAHDAFTACVRRLQRGARQGFPPRSLSAALAELCPRGLRAHRGYVSPRAKVSLSASHYHFYVQTRREDARTLIIRTYMSLASYGAAYRIHAHQLFKSRPHTPLRCASRTPARAPQRARRAPCWRRWAAPTTASARAAGRRAASTLLRSIEPRERLGRSPLRLLLAAGCAAQQAQPVRVEDASCAQGDQRRSPHRSRVHSVGGEDGG